MKPKKLKLDFNKHHKDETGGLFVEAVSAKKSFFKRQNITIDHFAFLSKDSESDIPENRLGQLISDSRWFIFLSIFIIILLGIIFRAGYLQIYKGREFRILAESNRIREVPILPKRGMIYDRNGIVLARNIPLYLLTVNSNDLPKDQEAILEILSSLKDAGIEISQDNFLADLSYKSEVLLKELEYKQALKIITLSQKFPGVEVKIYSRREYLDPLTLSHIMGYLGPLSEKEAEMVNNNYLFTDYIGKVGIEKFYENELRGSLGYRNIEVNALAKEDRLIKINEAIDGLNLHLTIDYNLQKKIYEILTERSRSNNFSRAAVVVINPNNGEILSLVSFPGFDNQKFYQGLNSGEYQAVTNNSDKPLFNRAISGQYPPGSTFKIIMAIAGLEEKLITPQTTFLSQGGIWVSRWFFPDWKAGGHGPTNIYKALAESVNTYFYILGGGYQNFIGLGVELIKAQAEKFGLGVLTNIDLIGEVAGFLPTPEWKESIKKEQWYIGDTYNLSIGQGDVLVTPLQMSMLVAAVANQGTLFRPHLVDYFFNTEDEILSKNKDWLIQSGLASQENLSVVARGLRETIISGSARSLNTLPIQVAGKTGTAQWHKEKKNHGWFVGFAPYKNPEIAWAVLVEEGGEGSESAVPIAKDFLTWYFTEYALK